MAFSLAAFSLDMAMFADFLKEPLEAQYKGEHSLGESVVKSMLEGSKVGSGG